MEIPDGDPVNDAINDAIPVYRYFLDKELVPQTYTINFDDYSSNYTGRQVHLGKEKNNMQWKYDSLLSEGYTQTTARSFLVENQKMTNELITVNDGIYTITLEPNDVILLKIRIDGVGNIQEEKSAFLGAYPNPTENTVYI